MGQLVQPKVYHVGFTACKFSQIEQYLVDTQQNDFLEDCNEALRIGLAEGEILCSMFAKLCYKSLVVGKNANVQKTRSVKKNLEGCFDSGHGSVFEHAYLNFVITNCSRVFTHELVRHRAGTAFSQTSGRYCRLDSIDLVWDPILDPVKEMWIEHLHDTEHLVYITECELGLRKPAPGYETYSYDFWYGDDKVWIKPESKWVPDDTFNFDRRKKITSAIRRIAPNGQANEIAFSINLRALRQVIQTRTSEFAETEIRNVFGQIYHLVSAFCPMLFYKAKTKMVDGLIKLYGMKCQPYEIEIGDPKALEFWTTESLHKELETRNEKQVPG